MALIIDTSTGTMLTAETCVIVPDEAFTEEEWNDIENFSDSEISRIGRENGVPVSESEQLLQSIADALWGEGADTHWNADTIQAVADAIQSQRPDLVGARSEAPPSLSSLPRESGSWAPHCACGPAAFPICKLYTALI
jgi:hypothetical protein